MRILFFSLLCAGLFTFSSCGSDDDGPSITLTQADVTGTWTIAKLDTDAELIVADQGTTTTTSIEGGPVTMTFNDDGTWTSGGDFTNVVVTIITTNRNSETGVGSGTYRVAGDKVYITGLELNNSSAPDSTEELEFFVKAFTADTNLDLEASPNSIVRIFGVESGAKADIQFNLEQ
jgi:hypothetical protein